MCLFFVVLWENGGWGAGVLVFLVDLLATVSVASLYKLVLYCNLREHSPFTRKKQGGKKRKITSYEA